MLGPSSNVINGQLLGLPQGFQFSPRGYGPGTVTVPASPPTVPPGVQGGSTTTQASAAGSGMGQVGRYKAAAAANPWSPRTSVLPWAVVGLIFAVLMLHYVHYRETLFGATESAHVGPVHEAAAAGA